MTDTITYTYDGRTFTLDEDYEHPDYGRVKFILFYLDEDVGYFRDENCHRQWLRYDSFPPPEPEPETVTLTLRSSHDSIDAIFTHDEARAAIKALQDALGETP